MSDLRTLAIVLNWQQAQMTLSCVQSLQSMPESDLDILVIDNGSRDDSINVLKRHQNGFELQVLPHNVGFAAGNNHGLRQAISREYDYALLINNDAFAAPDMLSHLLAEVQADIGLLSPKILYDSEPDRIWFAGGRRHPATLDMLNISQGKLDHAQRIISHDVDYLLGACLLVNLQAARVVGLLDERYFFYFEDLDWSLRFTEAGYRLRLVADAHVFHRVSTSTGGQDDSALRRYYLAFGSVLFWKNNAYLGQPGVILAFRIISAVKMVSRLTLTGRWRVAIAYLRGLRDGWQASSNDGISAGYRPN